MDILEHKSKALMVVAVALSAIVLAGFVGASFKNEDLVVYHPNDRANHHPLHETSTY